MVDKLKISYILSILGAVLILLPLVFMVVMLLNSEASSNWVFIRDFALRGVLTNTAIVTVLSALSAGFVGTILAILMSLYDFPLKKILNIFLVLPLALPPYIAAFSYVRLLSFTGPVQVFLRTNFNTTGDLFSIMNIPGAVFIFTITLYPYVYLIAKAFLQRGSGSIIENARLLGGTKLIIFAKVVLPIMIPAIMAGATLVGLEVLNDYGVTSYFGVRTLSVLILQAWHGMFDLNLAVRVSATTVGFVLFFVLIMRLLANDKKYRIVSSKERALNAVPLKSYKAIMAIGLCLIVSFISFFVPVIQMIAWTNNVNIAAIAGFALNSVYVAALGTIVIIVFSLLLANTNRYANRYMRSFFKLTTYGYALPSSVLAIGVIVTVQTGGFSLWVLIFAYFVKYFALGFGIIERGFVRTGNIYTENARTLGVSPIKAFFKVDVFMVKNFIISGGILVFVDLLKELPLTLVLRPFNFDTLSTRVYMFAINEQIAEAAPFSLGIILISAVFIIIANHFVEEWIKNV